MASVVTSFEEQRIVPKGEQTLVVEQLPIRDSKRFGLPHAEPGVAYLRHPAVAQRLLTLANYHADIVMEKANEAILMLTALSASSIELEYATQVSKEVKAHLEAIFGLISLSGGSGAVPRPVPPLVWLDQPGWRGIIDSRLYGGMHEFALTFTYEHKGGVDADLVSRARKFGAHPGGDFRKAHNVAFSLRGAFPPLPGAA